MSEPTAWVCVNRCGDIIVSTVRKTRRESIDSMVGKELGRINRWRHFKRWGARCQRVRLVSLDAAGSAEGRGDG